MLRILFIEKGKNTKTNNFKALNIGKIILKIVKLKSFVNGHSTNRGELRTLKIFQISINNYRGFRI